MRMCLRSSRSSNITIEPVSPADSQGLFPERNGSSDSQLPSRNTSLESNYDEPSSDQPANGTADSSGHSARSGSQTPVQERRGEAQALLALGSPAAPLQTCCIAVHCTTLLYSSVLAHSIDIFLSVA